MINDKKSQKTEVKRHWEDETCGVRYGSLDEIEKTRYELEPFILDFADFKSGYGKKVLEIGVGAGSDFANWVKNGAIASYKLFTADAENLPFSDNEFDIVYSWGVLHHTPDTFRALAEAFRVLKSGGVLKIMLYRVPSWTGFLLWIQHCLLKGKFWRGPKWAIFHHLESPGTKAYTKASAREMLTKIGFKNIHLKTKLCAGDLLKIKPSKKYQSAVYKIIWKLYPRWIVKAFGDRFGLDLLIMANK
ncbi:methyltransferase domain-containing protein [Candidatus Peregrinibacteria bacterium]|nr:methyltransferase domain-containing protein [Candidatus Peregrinibacteria bacterium]